MSGKYGEPWEVSPISGRIVDNGKELLSSWENRRACACVNALEGIANPQAVKAVIEAARDFQRVMRQNQGSGNGRPDFLSLIWSLQKTDAALAALEGK